MFRLPRRNPLLHPIWFCAPVPFPPHQQRGKPAPYQQQYHRVHATLSIPECRVNFHVYICNRRAVVRPDHPRRNSLSAKSIKIIRPPRQRDPLAPAVGRRTIVRRLTLATTLKNGPAPCASHSPKLTDVSNMGERSPASSCGNTASSDSFPVALPPLSLRREPSASISKPHGCARAPRPPEFPVFRWNAPPRRAIADLAAARAAPCCGKESQLARSRSPARGCFPATGNPSALPWCPPGCYQSSCSACAPPRA